MTETKRRNCSRRCFGGEEREEILAVNLSYRGLEDDEERGKEETEDVRAQEEEEEEELERESKNRREVGEKKTSNERQ